VPRVRRERGVAGLGPSLVRAWRVFLVLGGVLALAGGMLLVSSVLPTASEETIVIPEGPSNYVAYEVRILGSGRVSGSFEDTSGRVVAAFVFSEAAYQWYAFIGAGTPISEVRGAAGTFDATLPGSGTYYLVFAHPTWDDAATQVVRVRVVFDGVKPGFIEGSGVLLVLGMLLAVHGARVRTKDAGRVGASALV